MEWSSSYFCKTQASTQKYPKSCLKEAIRHLGELFSGFCKPAVHQIIYLETLFWWLPPLEEERSRASLPCYLYRSNHQSAQDACTAWTPAPELSNPRSCTIQWEEWAILQHFSYSKFLLQDEINHVLEQPLSPPLTVQTAQTRKSDADSYSQVRHTAPLLPALSTSHLRCPKQITQHQCPECSNTYRHGLTS